MATSRRSPRSCRDVVERSRSSRPTRSSMPASPTERYDALLDEYEPGATEEQLSRLLGELRDELSPLVKAVAESGVVVDESPARGTFPEAAQLALGRTVASAIGYDFDGGRLDASAHPFTTGFGPGDVRITWRAEPDDFRPGLFGIMHEAGHAMYEQGLPGRPGAHPARRGGVARDPREPVPALGEPGRPVPTVLGVGAPPLPRPRFPDRRTSPSTRCTRRCTRSRHR